MNYLITGIGRTGTTWLAKCLGWDHEPKVFNGCAVSPRHLDLLASGDWVLPKNTKVAIVTRDPRDQMLSTLNRWHGLGNFSARRAAWCLRLPGYLNGLYKLKAKEGAKIIRYDVMTKDEASLRSALEEADMPFATVAWTNEKFNTHAKTIESLPEWAVPYAEEIAHFYNTILDDDYDE